MIPSTINMQTTATPEGTRQIEVRQLGPTDTPDHDGGKFAARLEGYGWGVHRRSTVASHLKTWSVPEKVAEIAQRVERALEEGIPDQRRRFLRNQDFGMLDDAFMSDIALGEEVERPFVQWSKRKAAETRVAVCLDACVASRLTDEVLTARMAVCAGIAMALESLDYSVAITAASVSNNMAEGSRAPRETRNPSNVFAFVTQIKEEHDSYTESNFAHFSDTGLRRLVSCWVTKGDGRDSHLTDSEWRELTGADLLVFIGPRPGSPSYLTNNMRGLPSGAKVGPQGDDTLSLKVDRMSDIDSAIQGLESFFQAMAS